MIHWGFFFKSWSAKWKPCGTGHHTHANYNYISSTSSLPRTVGWQQIKKEIEADWVWDCWFTCLSWWAPTYMPLDWPVEEFPYFKEKLKHLTIRNERTFLQQLHGLLVTCKGKTKGNRLDPTSGKAKSRTSRTRVLNSLPFDLDLEMVADETGNSPVKVYFHNLPSKRHRHNHHWQPALSRMKNGQRAFLEQLGLEKQTIPNSHLPP